MKDFSIFFISMFSICAIESFNLKTPDFKTTEQNNLIIIYNYGLLNIYTCLYKMYVLRRRHNVRKANNKVKFTEIRKILCSGISSNNNCTPTVDIKDVSKCIPRHTVSMKTEFNKALKSDYGYLRLVIMFHISQFMTLGFA